MTVPSSNSKVVSLEGLIGLCNAKRLNGETTVLTNGCFDVLHSGHIEYLEASAEIADYLVVAINSDESVSTLKGPGRPVNREADRARVIAALSCVDAVVIFPGPRLVREIMAIRPNFYTKAGDYTPETLEPTERYALDSVDAKIRIMPFKSGFSSSRVIDCITSAITSDHDRLDFQLTLKEINRLTGDCVRITGPVEQSTKMILQCLQSGGKVLSCGNGGSAADALHLAEELVGRFRLDRKSLPAICLNADPTSITCIGNDFGFENIFSRPVDGLACEGDLLVGFTTSGNSENVLRALRVAKEKNVPTILLSGKDGGKSKGIADCEVIVPSNDTARIQEVHTVILHHWLEHVDSQFSKAV